MEHSFHPWGPRGGLEERKKVDSSLCRDWYEVNVWGKHELANLFYITLFLPPPYSPPLSPPLPPPLPPPSPSHLFLALCRASWYVCWWWPTHHFHGNRLHPPLGWGDVGVQVGEQGRGGASRTLQQYTDVGVGGVRVWRIIIVLLGIDRSMSTPWLLSKYLMARKFRFLGFKWEENPVFIDLFTLFSIVHNYKHVTPEPSSCDWWL